MQALQLLSDGAARDPILEMERLVVQGAHIGGADVEQVVVILGGVGDAAAEGGGALAKQDGLLGREPVEEMQRCDRAGETGADHGNGAARRGLHDPGGRRRPARRAAWDPPSARLQPWLSRGVAIVAYPLPFCRWVKAIHGLLESRRGPAGGHRLAAEPFEVTAADVIRAIDGPLAMTPCASVTAFRACDDCADVAKCRMRALMRRARDAVASVLEECTLADLIEEGRVLALLEQTPRHPARKYP